MRSITIIAAMAAASLGATVRRPEDEVPSLLDLERVPRKTRVRAPRKKIHCGKTLERPKHDACVSRPQSDSLKRILGKKRRRP